MYSCSFPEYTTPFVHCRDGVIAKYFCSII